MPRDAKKSTISAEERERLLDQHIETLAHEVGEELSRTTSPGGGGYLYACNTARHNALLLISQWRISRSLQRLGSTVIDDQRLGSTAADG